MHLLEMSLSLFHDGGVGWKHTRRRGKDAKRCVVLTHQCYVPTAYRSKIIEKILKLPQFLSDLLH